MVDRPSVAHDPTIIKPAHSREPGDVPTGKSVFKSKSMQVDGSGISMNWKLTLGILAFFISSGTLWTWFGLATAADVKAAHTVITKTPDGKKAERPLNELVVEHEEYRQEYLVGFKNVENRVGKLEELGTEVQDAQHEERAEDLAYRHIDKMPKRTPERRKIEEFNRVKKRAKSNLKKKRDIRDGLEGMAF
jgi:hypothetical protein